MECQHSMDGPATAGLATVDLNEPEREVSGPVWLRPWAHGWEQGEAYRIFVDRDGLFWAFDPDVPGGVLCPSHPWNVHRAVALGLMTAEEAEEVESS